MSRGGVALALEQRDLNFFHAIDHVVIRDDVAPRIDHHARPHAVHMAAGVGAGSLAGHGGKRLFAADVDHRRADVLHRDNDRILTQLGPGGEPRLGEQRKKRYPQKQEEQPGNIRRRACGCIVHEASIAGVWFRRAALFYRKRREIAVFSAG